MSVFRIAAAAALSCVSTVASAETPGRSRGEVAAAAPAPASELLYAPLNACRIALTSASTQGLIQPGTMRAFKVRGSANLASQGGSRTGCDVPAGATAIAVSATVKDSAAGFLTVNDAGGGGRTRFIQWRPNIEETATAVFPLASPGTEPALRVTSSAGGDVNLTLNVVGYYIPPIHALIGPQGTIQRGTTRVLSAVRTSEGIYEVRVDRDLSLCAISAEPVGGSLFSTKYILPGSNFATIYITDVNAGLYDSDFFFRVTC